MRINFRTQIIVSMILIIMGFISSLWFTKDMYYNLAWAFTGFLFFINPVYPINITDNSENSTRVLTVLTKSVIVLIEQENQVPERAPFQ